MFGDRFGWLFGGYASVPSPDVPPSIVIWMTRSLDLSIGRGQENTPDRLRLFRVVGGVAQNPNSVSYRIFDDTSGIPVQVHPGVDSEDVTNAPGRFANGAFFAYDNASGRGWTPGPTANLGNWHIEWDVQVEPDGEIVTFAERFSVVQSAAYAMPDPLYIGIADLYDRGIPSTLLPSVLEAEIRTWQSYIVRACRQWFHPVHLIFQVDGTDSDALHFGVPIIGIDELRINNDPNALNSAYFRVYNSGNRYPDNKANPRIKLIDEFAERRDIYTAPWESGVRRFRKGRQNQYISGTFGHQENGDVPLLIKRALLKITIEKATTPIYAGAPGVVPPAIISGVIAEEWTDGHKIKYDTSGTTTTPRSPGSGITQDPEIRGIIQMYRAPIGIATPNDPSVAR